MSVFLIHCFIALLCRYSSSIVSLLSCVSIPHPLFNCSPMSVFLILVHYLIALLCRYSSSIVSLLSCVDIPHPLLNCSPVMLFSALNTCSLGSVCHYHCLLFYFNDVRIMNRSSFNTVCPKLLWQKMLYCVCVHLARLCYAKYGWPTNSTHVSASIMTSYIHVHLIVAVLL